ncbi:hypothetical protein PSHT_00792 [Puccinia striiformis]|uniref:RING-type domain-containing protein n=1 Tax=Puccinia striiformis TaxID=27350 RepID=A0A2S4WM58_9BASI|nr:hypothetical protein PSHT_00792 [Puccinia striiformis]
MHFGHTISLEFKPLRLDITVDGILKSLVGNYHASELSGPTMSRAISGEPSHPLGPCNHQHSGQQPVNPDEFPIMIDHQTERHDGETSTEEGPSQLEGSQHTQSTTPNDDRCPICLSGVVGCVVVDKWGCGHLIHEDCLERWRKFETWPICAICRTVDPKAVKIETEDQDTTGVVRVAQTPDYSSFLAYSDYWERRRPPPHSNGVRLAPRRSSIAQSDYIFSRRLDPILRRWYCLIACITGLTGSLILALMFVVILIRQLHQ